MPMNDNPKDLKQGWSWSLPYPKLSSEESLPQLSDHITKAMDRIKANAPETSPAPQSKLDALTQEWVTQLFNAEHDESERYITGKEFKEQMNISGEQGAAIKDDILIDTWNIHYGPTPGSTPAPDGSPVEFTIEYTAITGGQGNDKPNQS